MNSFRWRLTMAWRESRGSRMRLLFFVLSLAVGVGAVTSLVLLRAGIGEAVEQQARTLLGADLQVSQQGNFPQKILEIFQEIKGEQAQTIALPTMVSSLDGTKLRLSQLRVISGKFPFYGEFETTPAEAARTFQERGQILVDNNLLLQLDAKVGTALQIGSKTFVVAGVLQKVPGEFAAQAMFAPRVYLPEAQLADTGLVQKGSRLRYAKFFKFADKAELQKAATLLTALEDKYHFEVDTVESRKGGLGDAMENASRFFTLMGFVALLLGATGLGSAVFVWIEQKKKAIALLRVLGVEANEVVDIYFIQVMAACSAGALLGAVAGFAALPFLAQAFAAFLPVEIQWAANWNVFYSGIFLGLLFSTLFCALALVGVRYQMPFRVLRGIEDNAVGARREQLLLLTFILCAVFVYAAYQVESIAVGMGFVLGLVLTLAVLLCAAKALLWLSQKLADFVGNYEVRQGLWNMHRVNNQSLLIVTVLGTGACLLASVMVLQNVLLSQLDTNSDLNSPNTVIFDIQPEQREDLSTLLTANSYPVLQTVPIVSMRLVAVNSIPSAQIAAANKVSKEVEPWALRRVYQSTFRTTLAAGEEVIEGKYDFENYRETSPIPISVAERITKALKIGLGTKLSFEIEGEVVETEVTSIRKVDWQRIQPNFFFVFPPAALERFPQVYAMATRSEGPARALRLQQIVVERFSNVSTIDLSAVLQTVRGIVDKLQTAINSVSIFTVLAGLLVLVAAMMSGATRRVREAMLLKAIGASRAQVRLIFLIEYLSLGVVAGLTGLLLAVIVSLVVVSKVFAGRLSIEPSPIAVVFSGVPAVSVIFALGLTCVIVGFVSTRRVYNGPALEMLKDE